MKAEIKQRWVEALRSGKYEQGQGMLRNGNKYCCLGVLQVVLNNGDESKVREGGHFLNEEEFYLAGLGSQSPLVNLNDMERKSFPEIADWIEANIEATDKTSN